MCFPLGVAKSPVGATEYCLSVLCRPYGACFSGVAHPGLPGVALRSTPGYLLSSPLGDLWRTHFFYSVRLASATMLGSKPGRSAMTRMVCPAAMATVPPLATVVAVTHGSGLLGESPMV